MTGAAVSSRRLTAARMTFLSAAGRRLSSASRTSSTRAGQVMVVEQLVDILDGAREAVGLVRGQDEIGVLQAPGGVLELRTVAVALGEARLQPAQPGEDRVIQQCEARSLSDVAPATVLVLALCGLRPIRPACVDRRLAALGPTSVEGFQLADKQQVGDLLDGNERVGDADAPEPGPQAMGVLSELRRQHGLRGPRRARRPPERCGLGACGRRRARRGPPQSS